MADEARIYQFNWNCIGDIEEGRPNLGNMTRIEVYRLFQYALRDVLERQFGTEMCDRLLWQAGFLAGSQFAEKFVGPCDSLDSFLFKTTRMLLDMKVGVLRMEQADVESMRFTLTVAEDLDCSGLPDVGHVVCSYDEGFIAGLLYAHTGRHLEVREVDCWCTGGRTCRFEATLPPDSAGKVTE